MSKTPDQNPYPLQLTGQSTPFWPNIEIKGRIRQALGDRILGFILALGQNLKRKARSSPDLIEDLKAKIGSPIPLLATVLVITTAGTQADLESFGSDEPHTPGEPPEPNVKGDPKGDDDLSPQSDDEDSEEDGQEDDSPTGLIYARVSSDKQRKGTTRDDGDVDEDDGVLDEGSIEGQVEELEEIAERRGIQLPYDPIADEAETGTDFDRDGIQEVFEKTKRKDIDYLLVEKVDRVGRTAAETLYFIYILQSECGVTLLTSSGSRDVSETPGLMQTTVMSLTAQIQNELRIAKANKERIRGFLKKKNWTCKSPKIPMGYEETDDGWLTVDPEEKPIVRDVFRKFETCGNYAETGRYIDDEYGKEHLDGHRVKTILQNRVYIGQPRLPENWLEGTTYGNDLHEPELHLLRAEDDAEVDVCEETFHRVQNIIQQKEQQHSDEDTMELLDFIEEFSLFSVIQGSDPATLLHHCGHPLIRDGQLDLKGEYTVHRYRCRHCEETENASDYYRRWPKEYEFDKIRLIQQVIDDDEPDYIDTK